MIEQDIKQEVVMTVKIYKEFPREAKELREEVFIKEQGFSYDYDEKDDVAVHIVMFDKDVPIAVCRVFEDDDESTYILGRLAVKRKYRGRGIGSKLVTAAEHHIVQIGGKELILHSQMQAKNFYERVGFAEYGEIEYEEDCPHIWMKKYL